MDIPRTTLVLRNLPENISKNDFIDILTEINVLNQIDFFYLCFDYKNKKNTGIAFINFIDPNDAKKFLINWNNKEQIGFLKLKRGNKNTKLNITYSYYQGFDNCYKKTNNTCKDENIKPWIRIKSDISHNTSNSSILPPPGLEEITPRLQIPPPGLEEITSRLQIPPPGLEEITPRLQIPPPGLEEITPINTNTLTIGLKITPNNLKKIIISQFELQEIIYNIYLNILLYYIL